MDGSPTLRRHVLCIVMGNTYQYNPIVPMLITSKTPICTWVRLAQHIPVGHHITHVPPGVLVSAGMTCTVVMKEGAAPDIGLGVRKLITAIFGAPGAKWDFTQGTPL